VPIASHFASRPIRTSTWDGSTGLPYPVIAVDMGGSYGWGWISFAAPLCIYWPERWRGRKYCQADRVQKTKDERWCHAKIIEQDVAQYRPVQSRGMVDGQGPQ